MKYSMHKEEVRNLLASAMVHPATVIVEQLEYQEQEIKALEAEKTELMAEIEDLRPLAAIYAEWKAFVLAGKPTDESTVAFLERVVAIANANWKKKLEDK